jgi:hypothetical protein
VQSILWLLQLLLMLQQQLLLRWRGLHMHAEMYGCLLAHRLATRSAAAGSAATNSESSREVNLFEPSQVFAFLFLPVSRLHS